jgi:hypothetical protein
MLLKIIDIMEQNKDIIFLDESGFSNQLKPCYGWDIKG